MLGTIAMLSVSQLAGQTNLNCIDTLLKSSNIIKRTTIAKKNITHARLSNIIMNKGVSKSHTSIDTSTIYFIPIIISHLNFGQCDPNVLDLLVPEILYVNKSNGRIIGSCKFDKNSSAFTEFTKSTKIINTVPPRIDNRLDYLNPRLYNKVSRSIRANNNSFALFYIPELKDLFMWRKNDGLKFILRYEYELGMVIITSRTRQHFRNSERHTLPVGIHL